MDKFKFKVKALKTIDSVYDKIEKFDKKRDELNESLKENYDKQKAALMEKRIEMGKQLDKIENTTGETWKEAKEIFSESMKHYKAGFAELAKLFK